MLYNRNESYRQALKATGGDILVYHPDRNRADRYILTEYHFIRRLRWLYHYGQQYDFNDFIPDEMQRRLPFQISADDYDVYNQLLGDAFAAVHVNYDKEKAIELVSKARQVLVNHAKAGSAQSKKALKAAIDGLAKWANDIEQIQDGNTGSTEINEIEEANAEQVYIRRRRDTTN